MCWWKFKSVVLDTFFFFKPLFKILIKFVFVKWILLYMDVSSSKNFLCSVLFVYFHLLTALLFRK